MESILSPIITPLHRGWCGPVADPSLPQEVNYRFRFYYYHDFPATCAEVAPDFRRSRRDGSVHGLIARCFWVSTRGESYHCEGSTPIMGVVATPLPGTQIP